MIDHPLAIQVRLILLDSEMSWDTTHFIFFTRCVCLDAVYPADFIPLYPKFHYQ